MKKIVLYTDGACKPNPGYGGFGIFGYTCLLKENCKPSKHPIENVYFTSNGFKEVSENNVSVIDIVEHIECLSDTTTNNTVELFGVIRGLEIISKLTYEINEVLILTDSNYIVGAIENLSKWKQNNWKKQDGTVVVHRVEWERIFELLEEFKGLSISVNIQWIKGHSGNFGNDIADFYSSVGSNSSLKTKENIIFSKVSNFKEYRSSFNNKDFIHTFRDMFFSPNNDKASFYFLTNLDKNNLNIGKRNVESLFALNVGYVPSYIDDVKLFIKNDLDNLGFYCIKLNRLENKNKLRLLNFVNVNYLLYRHGNAYFICKDESPFILRTNITFPLIINVSNMFTNLSETYESLNNFNYVKVDVTKKLIDNEKLILTNKTTDIDFSDCFVNTEIEKRLIQKVTLKLGYDIPSYLTLKSIEEFIEKIELILDVNEEKLTVTCYFKISCKNRDIVTCNIVNKFFLTKEPL